MIRMITAAVLLTASSSAFAEERSIDITGSVQFWQRSCTEAYECGLPMALSERVSVSSVISQPLEIGQVTTEELTFTAGPLSAKLGVYWKNEVPVSYLAGQTLLLVDGKRVAECSNYGSDQVEYFIPVGFCAGYVYGKNGISQYGVTYYRAPVE